MTPTLIEMGVIEKRVRSMCCCSRVWRTVEYVDSGESNSGAAETATFDEQLSEIIHQVHQRQSPQQQEHLLLLLR